jgi:two-component system sensor histidine kinase YesM
VHDVYEAEIKTRDYHYYALQAQLNPHFLLNSLENLRMVALMNGEENTSKMIYKLARIMDYTIRQDQRVSTIEKEIEHCRNYLEFCVMRMGLSFSIDCPTELANVDCPKFMLQPVVENAVEHAFEPGAKEKNIKISARLVEGKIELAVKDNGKGIDREQLSALENLLLNYEKSQLTGKRIGLINVHERLKIFYGESYGIGIDSIPDKGTTVTLLLGTKPLGEFLLS